MGVISDVGTNEYSHFNNCSHHAPALTAQCWTVFRSNYNATQNCICSYSFVFMCNKNYFNKHNDLENKQTKKYSKGCVIKQLILYTAGRMNAFFYTRKEALKYKSGDRSKSRSNKNISKLLKELKGIKLGSYK